MDNAEATRGLNEHYQQEGDEARAKLEEWKRTTVWRLTFRSHPQTKGACIDYPERDYHDGLEVAMRNFNEFSRLRVCELKLEMVAEKQ